MLSGSIQERLELARLKENDYRPSLQIAAGLQQKSLVMLVGPVAIGKSSIMNQVVKTKPQFSRVSGFTTRAQRHDDEAGIYKYFPHDDAGISQVLDLIKERQLVQYAIHPTTGFIYASRLQDYPNDFNLLDTLSSVVIGLKRLPFKQTFTIGVVARADDWRARLLQRFPKPSQERTKRLQEAVQSLQWQLSQPEADIYWLENPQDDLNKAASDLVKIVLNDKRFEKRSLPKQMLQIAKELLND